jgi:carboxyl-terminal processing protease
MTFPASLFCKRAAVVAAAAMMALWSAAPVAAREPDATASAEAASTPDRDRARMNARVFDTVWDTVRRRYYDPNLHGVDWRAARETYRPEAQAATDDRVLYRTLGQMLDLLDDDHAAAVSPAQARRQDQARTRRAVMGVMLARVDGDAWRIDAVRAGSPAEEAGIQVGWVLQTVDGQAWGVDFDVEAGRPITLTFLDETAQTRTVTLIPREMDPARWCCGSKGSRRGWVAGWATGWPRFRPTATWSSTSGEIRAGCCSRPMRPCRAFFPRDSPGRRGSLGAAGP